MEPGNDLTADLHHIALMTQHKRRGAGARLWQRRPGEEVLHCEGEGQRAVQGLWVRLADVPPDRGEASRVSSFRRCPTSHPHPRSTKATSSLRSTRMQWLPRKSWKIQSWTEDLSRLSWPPLGLPRRYVYYPDCGPLFVCPASQPAHPLISLSNTL